jgi:hypothetical protein
MGRYIEQTESRSELQQKIAADLRAKASAKAKQEADAITPGVAVDGVEDSAYVQGTKSTTTLAPVWALIAVASVVVFAYFVYQVNK